MDLKAWRIERKLTKEACAGIIGMSADTWANIEAGNRDWKPGEEAAVQRLLRAYDEGKWDAVEALSSEQDCNTLYMWRVSLDTPTCAEAARLVGCSESHWSKMERGKEITKRYSLIVSALRYGYGEPKPAPNTPASPESVKPEPRPNAVPPRELDARGDVPPMPEAPKVAAVADPEPSLTAMSIAAGAALMTVLGAIEKELATLRLENARLSRRVDALETPAKPAPLPADMAARRAYISECVTQIVTHISSKPGRKWYGRIWSAVHKAAGVSNLADITTPEQADRAIAALKEEAGDVSLILKAYQPMLPGVAV